MKKINKVLFAVTLAAIGAISVTSCNKKKYDDEVAKVGIVFSSSSASNEITKYFLTNELGPALNMEFIYSDVVQSAEALTAFIENCQLAGCKGIVNSDLTDAAVAIEYCQENGIYIENQKTTIDTDNGMDKYEYNVGNCGVDLPGMAENYEGFIEKFTSDGKNHSMIVNGFASVYGSEMMVYSVVGALTAFQNKYNLTYKYKGNVITPAELARTNVGGEEIDTGNKDIKVFFVDGVDASVYTGAVSQALNTGDYDILVSAYGFTQFSNYVEAAEKANNIDVKVCCTTLIEDATFQGFNSGILDAACINPLNAGYIYNCICLRNAIDGYASMYKKDGSIFVCPCRPWAITTKEQIEKVSQLDNLDTKKWLITAEEAKTYCKRYNEDTTLEDIEKLLTDISDVDKLLEKRGL